MGGHAGQWPTCLLKLPLDNWSLSHASQKRGQTALDNWSLSHASQKRGQTAPDEVPVMLQVTLVTLVTLLHSIFGAAKQRQATLLRSVAKCKLSACRCKERKVKSLKSPKSPRRPESAPKRVDSRQKTVDSRRWVSAAPARMLGAFEPQPHYLACPRLRGRGTEGEGVREKSSEITPHPLPLSPACGARGERSSRGAKKMRVAL
jgi:hypothetical protein